MTESFVPLKTAKVLALCEAQRVWASSEERQSGRHNLYIVGDIERLCRASLAEGQTTINVTPHDYGRLTLHQQFTC